MLSIANKSVQIRKEKHALTATEEDDEFCDVISFPTFHELLEREQASSLDQLRWTAGADNRSKRNIRRKKSEYRKAATLTGQTLLHMGWLSEGPKPNDVITFDADQPILIKGFEQKKLQDMVDEIERVTKITKNKKLQNSIELLDYDKMRLRTVRRYFMKLIDGNGKMESSLAVVKELFRGNVYASRLVRYWSQYYYENGNLPISKQGCHQKIPVLIEDEDIKRKCLAYLQGMRPNELSVVAFKTFIETRLLPELEIAKSKVSENTVRNWLHLLEYRLCSKTKGSYIDGHE